MGIPDGMYSIYINEDIDGIVSRPGIFTDNMIHFIFSNTEHMTFQTYLIIISKIADGIVNGMLSQDPYENSIASEMYNLVRQTT